MTVTNQGNYLVSKEEKKLWLARYILEADHLSLPNSRPSGFLFCLISMESAVELNGQADMI